MPESFYCEKGAVQCVRLPERKNSMANNLETKKERFRRVAEKRVNKILDQIRILGKCSGTNIYSYQKNQVEQIFTCLQNALNEAHKKFNNSSPNGKERFSLSDTGVHQSMEKRFPTVALIMPDGSKVFAAVVDDENFPAIEVYLVRPGEKEEEKVCFVEYNPEREEGPRICIGAYQSDEDDTKVYMPYDVN